MRNRRYVSRRGPLLVYNEDKGVVKAFRNIPGVELVQVSRLNILQLAPGGHLGRFIIWTKSAFDKLDALYGTPRKASTLKKDYRLPHANLTNADITRIINSDEVQSALRAKKRVPKFHTHKKNPLRNVGALLKLNPYAKSIRRREILLKLRANKKLKPASKAKVAAKPKTAAKKAPKKPKAAKTTKPVNKKALKIELKKQKTAFYKKLVAD